MTLVTAASGGQDISVGSAIAIAGSVVLRVLCGTNSRPDTLQAPIIVAFLACCVVSMLFGAFNGTLVAVFKIQPMVATLILYTAGRSIAAWINNNELPMISDPAFAYYGNFLPGVAVPTPIFIAVICMVLAWALLRLFWLRARAVAIVDCNGQLQKLRPETVHLYLTHGSPLKSVHDYYFCDPTTDWALSQAPFFDAVNSYEFHIPPEKLVTLGFPRNDDLFTHKCDLKDIFGAEFDRFVVWYPTYRQHKNNLVATTDISVPVIHDPAAAAAVNEAARATNTLVIVKPHPAQDLSHIRALELSHLRFIDDGLFAAHGITSYEFLACTDALITDYSSVLFDYLLTGKPVGLTFEDIDAYAKQPGFAIDPQPLRESAAPLDTPDDFRTFFEQLAAGDDPLRAKRLQLTKLTNQYTDGHSAERVAAFLAERLREREHT
jgi:uncharacterized membrane protein YciS (DUF1049 family)